MAHIELTISNINNGAYSGIILRKFFHMIFVSPDGKKLNIYTATVFGGVKASNSKDKKEEQTDTENSVIIPKCTYDSKMECSLRFEYSGSEGCIESIQFADLTKSLWTQTECLERVWGHCERLDTQEKIKTTFQELYSDTINASGMSINLDWPIYYIHEDGKANHSCLVSRGDFKIPNSKNNSSYYLRSYTNAQYDGIEVMNWVKTEIVLTNSILNKHTSFKISLNNEAGCQYFTPDFTWYFAPPAGYSIDNESATVRIQAEMRNLVQDVAGETTVNFKEWTQKEHIKDRQKSRVYISPHTISNPRYLSDHKGIEVGVSIRNPHQSANRQFLVGLLIAFILSFCADKTRLNDYCSSLKLACTCGESCICQYVSNALSFVCPMLALLTYLSMMFSTVKCITMENLAEFWICRIIKSIGILCTIAILLYVFLAWAVFTPIMQNIVSSCDVNLKIIGIISALGFAANILYLGYCMRIKKKRPLDYI